MLFRLLYFFPMFHNGTVSTGLPTPVPYTGAATQGFDMNLFGCTVLGLAMAVLFI